MTKCLGPAFELMLVNELSRAIGDTCKVSGAQWCAMQERT